MIGWNQERLDGPKCKLCTNTVQSYTIPVTIFLPDDGWCPVGRVPTGWKLEVTMPLMSQYANSDTTLAMVVNDQAQVEIVNNNESSVCQGIRENILYDIPDKS